MGPCVTCPFGPSNLGIYARQPMDCLSHQDVGCPGGVHVDWGAIGQNAGPQSGGHWRPKEAATATQVSQFGHDGSPTQEARQPVWAPTDGRGPEQHHTSGRHQTSGKHCWYFSQAPQWGPQNGGVPWACF